MDLQGGPTFEDLSIDDELSQLQRLVRYSSSSIALQRLVHVKVSKSQTKGLRLPAPCCLLGARETGLAYVLAAWNPSV